MKPIDDLKNLSKEEILKEIEKKRGDLRNLKASHAVTPLKNPMQIRLSRKTIARLQTLLKSKVCEMKVDEREVSEVKKAETKEAIT